MKNRVGPSLYFASDKVIFDALNQRQVGTDLVRDLFSDRGIYVSQKTPKEDLAKYFSRLIVDYFEHHQIAAKLGRFSRKERFTHSEIASGFSSENLRQAAQNLKTSLETHDGLVNITQAGDRLILEVSYEHIDYTKSELRQVQRRDSVIEISPGEDGRIVVRNTQNEFTDTVVDQYLHNLSSIAGVPLDQSHITLQGHADHKLRNKFFDILIRRIDGFDFSTVKEAFCFKPHRAQIAEEESEDDEPRELQDQPYIERVILRGQGVDRSFFFADLGEKEYYVVKVVWLVRPVGRVDADFYELEAQFSSPDICTDFSYQVRSLVTNEAGRPTDKKRPTTLAEQDQFFRLIEKAARSALHEVGVDR